jgi:vacuolar-type H+-ATPase subunit H
VFAEELAKIKESEAYAEELQKSAKTEAESLVAEAESQARQIVADAKILAKKKVDDLMSEGEELAQAQYDAAITAAEQQCRELADAIKEKQPEMVKLIVERVKSSVN